MVGKGLGQKNHSNSETGRRRRRTKRWRFVIPRSGATLKHLIKRFVF
jgi:hypothetical protein